ncbi:hypothetical protein GCM10010399_90980 [Dactylosporangium fulvum]
MLAAGAGTLAAVGVVVAVLHRPPADAGPSPVAEASATGRAVDPAALVVRDGARVEASGQVILTPGKPARFCAPAPTDLMLRDTAPTCSLGVDVVGVDPGALTDPRQDHGSRVGSALLRGTWRDGTLTVTEQAAPRAEPLEFDWRVPCPAPRGGWTAGDADADGNRLYEYIHNEHPEWFREPRVGYPGGAPTGATDGPQPTRVMIVEIVAGDAGAVDRELRELFRGNLCVVSSPGRSSIADQRRLRAQADAVLDPLMRDPANGIYTVGGDNEITVELVVLTPALLEKLRPAGLDNLALSPWLRPVS